MNLRAIGYELRTILRTYLPPGSAVHCEAVELVRQLEEAAVRALQDEVRRLGT